MSQPVEYTIAFAQLGITREEVAGYMGYTLPESIPGPVMDVIDEALETSPALCEIRGGYVVREPAKADTERKIFVCGGQEFTTNQIVTHQLRRAEAAAFFVCTVGKALSEKTRQLMQTGDLLNGYAFDVVANVAVDLAMDIIQEEMKPAMAERGWKITNRYSPGYCNWDVSEQQKLFSLLPEAFLGVTLSESSLMSPVKSISGVIGLGSEVKFSNYTCNLCNQEHCLYRHRKSR